MATTAHRDPNRIPNSLDVSTADFTTQVEPASNPTSHARIVEINNTLVTLNYDYVSRSDNGTDTVTWVFKSGGASGTTVATIVIVYTDSTFSTIVSVTKT